VLEEGNGLERDLDSFGDVAPDVELVERAEDDEAEIERAWGKWARAGITLARPGKETNEMGFAQLLHSEGLLRHPLPEVPEREGVCAEGLLGEPACSGGIEEFIDGLKGLPVGTDQTVRRRAGSMREIPGDVQAPAGSTPLATHRSSRRISPIERIEPRRGGGDGKAGGVGGRESTW
jgi:hypothetical protein